MIDSRMKYLPYNKKILKTLKNEIKRESQAPIEKILKKVEEDLQAEIESSEEVIKRIEQAIIHVNAFKKQSMDEC
jgi:hypothetical protein